MKLFGLGDFKCPPKCSPIYITNMSRISDTPFDTRSAIKLIQPKTNTNKMVQNRIVIRETKSRINYRHLSKEYRTYRTCYVYEFKCRLKECPGLVCKCSSCELYKFNNIWTIFVIKDLFVGQHDCTVLEMYMCICANYVLYIYIYLHMCLLVCLYV